MSEYWKPIKGYEGLYEISNSGKVKSLPKRSKNGRYWESRIMKGSNNGKYLVQTLTKNGESKMFTIHRLVAITFIDNPLNKKIVHHRNENKLDNRVDNLEWVTSSENKLYDVHGIIPGNRKRVDQLDRDGNLIKTWNSISEAAEVLDVSAGNISRVCNGSRKSIVNCIWKYHKEEEIY